MLLSETLKIQGKPKIVDFKQIIGQRIRQLRESRRSAPHRKGRETARKMTIEDLAERAGLSADYVNKLELGRYKPSAESLLKIATALDVGIAELFPEHNTEQGEKQEALDTLRAFASQFNAQELRYALRVLKVVMEGVRS